MRSQPHRATDLPGANEGSKQKGTEAQKVPQPLITGIEQAQIGTRESPGIYSYLWTKLDPIAPLGLFSVSPQTVRSGKIRGSDIIHFAFSFPTHTNLRYVSLDGGEFEVNPETGEILFGALDATYSNTDGQKFKCVLAKDSIQTEHDLGHFAFGEWKVRFVTPPSNSPLFGHG